MTSSVANVACSPKLPLQTRKKICFVTIGATAGFDTLIHAVLSPPFRHALREHRYTDLRVQYGKDENGVYKKAMRSVDAELDAGEDGRERVRVSGFGFDPNGLDGEMKAAKGLRSTGRAKNVGEEEKRMEEGVVISHAGQRGSISRLSWQLPWARDELRTRKRNMKTEKTCCYVGSGSILAALRIAVPIIVVPNAELLDNHQVELAEELARQGYVVHGNLA